MKSQPRHLTSNRRVATLIKEDDCAMLTTIAPGLFEATQPLRVAGFDLGHRMTVIQLPSGEVAVHSPVKLSTALARDVEQLGGSLERVRWIIAPSVMHDLYLAEWMTHFSRAQLLHSPGGSLAPNLSETSASLPSVPILNFPPAPTRSMTSTSSIRSTG